MTTEERIATLETCVAELKARVLALEHQRECRPRDQDIAVLRVLLPAIRGRIGGDPFKASELWSRIPAMPKLTTLSTHQLGMLFSRCAGIDIDGLHIQRTKTASGSLLWCLGLSPPSPPQRVVLAHSRLR